MSQKVHCFWALLCLLCTFSVARGAVLASMPTAEFYHPEQQKQEDSVTQEISVPYKPQEEDSISRQETNSVTQEVPVAKEQETNSIGEDNAAVPIAEQPKEKVAPPCSVCAPGYGVLSLCNGTHDTVCGECPAGTFSDSYTVDQPCRPCNSCPNEFYERTPCVPSQDVNCATCYKNGGGGFGNEDFLRKCETTTSSTTSATTTTTTTVPPSETTTTNILPPPKHRSKTTATQAITTTTEESQASTTTATTTTTEERLKPLPPVESGSEDLEEAVTEGVVLAAGVGDPNIAAATSIETGGFEWTIFVAAVAAAVVFFILGVLVSRCVHKPNTKAKADYALDYGEVPGDDIVDSAPTVTMLSNRPLEGDSGACAQENTGGAAVAYEDEATPGDDDVKTPIYTGNHE